MEPVYSSIIRVAKMLWAVEGLKFTVYDPENVPASGGAVIAINHTGYLDFTYAGLPAYGLFGDKRLVRFMAKKEVFDNKFTGPLMRGCKHIAVDREAGAASYHEAVEYLRRGELVGVYPEATISRSFEIKDLKTGAARMALEAGVPIVPHLVWGAQRVWTKGHPKRLGRTNTPIRVAVAEPIAPEGTVEELTTKLCDVMTAKLHWLQEGYDHPAGEYWVPARLGGGAPTLAEANRLDEEEKAQRAAQRRAT